MMSSRTRSVPTTGMRGGLGRTLLTAFLLSAIAPLSLVGYVAFSQVQSDRQRGTVDRLSTVADLREAQLRDWARSQAVSLENMAARLTPSDEASALQLAREQKTGLESAPVFSEVFLVHRTSDEKWIAVMSGEVGPRPGWAVSPREAQGRTLQGWLVAGSSPTFQFAAPVQGAAGQLSIFLVGLATFTPSDLSTSAITSGFGRTTTIHIVNRQRVTPALRQSPNGIATYRNAAGTQVIGLYRWLNDLQNGVLFKAMIEVDTKLKESPVFGQPVTLYAPNTRGTARYRALAQELMTHGW